MKAYKTEYLGSTIIHSSYKTMMECLSMDLDNMEIGDTEDIKITGIEMSEADIEALDEFEGF